MSSKEKVKRQRSSSSKNGLISDKSSSDSKQGVSRSTYSSSSKALNLRTLDGSNSPSPNPLYERLSSREIRSMATKSSPSGRDRPHSSLKGFSLAPTFNNGKNMSNSRSSSDSISSESSSAALIDDYVEQLPTTALPNGRSFEHSRTSEGDDYNEEEGSVYSHTSLDSFSIDEGDLDTTQ
jgi:hypothetical protein